MDRTHGAFKDHFRSSDFLPCSLKFHSQFPLPDRKKLKSKRETERGEKKNTSLFSPRIRRDSGKDLSPMVCQVLVTSDTRRKKTTEPNRVIACKLMTLGIRRYGLGGNFINIVRCHNSVDIFQVLLLFKIVISVHAHQFQDISQKDAHEFLTSVLDRMGNFSPIMSETAAVLGTTYSCPVREHLVFRTQNTGPRRFHITWFLYLEKLSPPINLFRELMVTSSQANGWYSLLIVISYLSDRGNTGGEGEESGSSSH
ncbi:hypothetical protein EXN66_Car010656 [Channa argus]|uniref:Uncharacterized protein n=1 Tax=Channa argus TaxID=215402 RepID=A0A6G1PXC4_CHAAH|nr:hypothetical protein EXN66_Car010656 [Channa argus]